VLGVRQSGKTTIAKNIAPDWDYFDLENAKDYERITHDLDFFFKQHSRQVIIDEAQEYPQLFKTLRGVVDQQRTEKGRFILTGSSNPELLDGISESLAGRVAIVELGTLKANEYYQKPLSKFYDLFIDMLSKKTLVSGSAPLTVTQMQKLWLYGGYPEPVLQSDINFYNQWMDNYSRTYINYDIAKLFPKLNKIAYRRFLSMLGQLSGTIINKRDLARSIEISEKTIKEYLDIAEGTFLWRNLLSYEKNVVKKIVKMPKGHLRDTGFLHYLLQIHNINMLYTNPLVGRSFEAFIILLIYPPPEAVAWAMV
jgi:predicted AAA+ superfamily ATPase